MKKFLAIILAILGTVIFMTSVSAELEPCYNYYKLSVGESFNLKTPDCTYESLDTKTATVDSEGNVKAVSVGKTDIIIKSAGGEAKTTVIVDDGKPVDLYAKGYEGGEEKLIMVLGDSLSYTTALNGNAQNWHGYIARQFNISVNNYSKGGTCISSGGVYPQSEWEGYGPRLLRAIEGKVLTETDAVAKPGEVPDILLVLGGTNDHLSNGKGYPLGRPGDRKTGALRGSVANIIETTYKHYPETEIVFMTPTNILNTEYGNTGKNGSGFEFDDYVEAIKETCAEYNVKCIDLYNNDRTDLVSFATRYHRETDGIHPSAEGYNLIGKVTIEELERLGVIKTYGYETEPAGTKKLIPGRPQIKPYYIYDFETIAKRSSQKGKFSYSASALISAQRYSSYIKTEEGLKFTPVESRTSRIAPTVTLNLNMLTFPIIDYPYVSLVYRTSSKESNVNVFLGGNDNHRSVLGESDETKITSGELTNLTLNVLDMANEGVTFGTEEIFNDYYLAYEFFKNTQSMAEDDYVDIIGVGFFKDEETAKSFDGKNARGSGFTDTLSHWACDNIDYVVRKGLFAGLSSTKFGPNENMTRAMLVTVLSRMAGDTENASEIPYKDVASDAWYRKAVAFAYSKNICDGTDSFRPDDNVTREELADMLCRYAKYMGKDTQGAELKFEDSSQITESMKNSVSYCVSAGIVSGYENGRIFKPKNSATRAEVATMIKRYTDIKD